MTYGVVWDASMGSTRVEDLQIVATARSWSSSSNSRFLSLFHVVNLKSGILTDLELLSEHLFERILSKQLMLNISRQKLPEKLATIYSSKSPYCIHHLDGLKYRSSLFLYRIQSYASRLTNGMDKATCFILNLNNRW